MAQNAVFALPMTFATFFQAESWFARNLVECLAIVLFKLRWKLTEDYLEVESLKLFKTLV